MQAGDSGTLWRHYSDYYKKVSLAAVRADDEVVTRNLGLKSILKSSINIDTCPVYSFFPRALRGSISNIVEAKAIMTGGRTFLLQKSSAELLGFPPVLYLDLKKIGWGMGFLEVRPEVKGAGTLFKRTRVNQQILESLLPQHPDLLTSYQSSRITPNPPELFSSLAMYDKRPLGGHIFATGCHSVSATAELLSNSLIKIVPSWYCVVQPREYIKNLSLCSNALDGNEDKYSYSIVSEVRLTPGSVRAAYFDQAKCDDELLRLISNVSTDPSELEKSLDEMLTDVARYIELLACTTEARPGGNLTWTKFGDIHIVFQGDKANPSAYAEEYRKVKSAAWYIAKDEIIVRSIGKLFVDLESFRGGRMPWVSHNKEEMLFQQELYIINILRDHNRVCTQFAIGIRLRKNSEIYYAERKAIQKNIMQGILEKVNRSACLRMELGAHDVRVTINYKKVPGLNQTFIIPRQQISERYI